MASAGYDRENADEFLENVNEITARVQKILAGDVDVLEEETRFQEAENLKKVKKEIRVREQQEHIAKGISGRGYKGNFKTFCKGCHTEYHHEAVEVCNRCGRDTTPNEERMAELRDKLEEHKIKQAKKLERRAKWNNWRKTQEMFYRKCSTNYAKWDVFESDSEDEIPEEEKEPIVPENDPQFKAMEADFADRAKKRKRNRKEANRLKDLGNEAMKKGLYKSANHHYTTALEDCKDMLPLYTNRALARIRLEMWQEVVDDCTRVLDYCDCFDDGYTKNRDLNYKALTRRGQAFRALNDFEQAIKDLAMAKILCPDQEDCQRLIDQYKQDHDHAKRIELVMSNAKDLDGREYIDFLLNAVQGKIPQTLSEVAAGQPTLADKKKVPRYCQHAIKPEESKKLKEILRKEDQDLVLYFNAKDGFRTLVDSLEFNTDCLELISDLVIDNTQLSDDFQRNHLYEALIDFMYKRNVNAEGAILAADKVHKILQILENGSMMEAVRMNLSEKKKVKDLFLVVIRAINIDENREVVSSLIQFASNLCYGTGKFRRLLISSQAPTDFIQTLADILTSIQKPADLLDAMQAEESKQSNILSSEHKRVLLKGTLLNFIGNLCVETQLRQYISQDMCGLLSQVFELLASDVKNKPFDWIDSGSRALQTLCNSSIEPAAQALLSSKAFDTVAVTVFKTLPMQPEEKEKQEMIDRILQLLSRLVKNAAGQEKIIQSKDILLKLHVYYSFERTNKSALITLHTLATQREDFKEVLMETHGFTLQSFRGFINTAITNFNRARETEAWDEYVNVCASITGFVGKMIETAEDFKDLIVPLIRICADKTDKVRKNSAVLLAKLVQNENNKKIMQANHGTEVLSSLQNSLLR